jgi:beta-lactamase regulating signal transducer with metallopeptidase domain
MNLEWLASPAWTSIVKALLHTLWQGAGIAVLLGLVLRRLVSPVMRYRFSLLALVTVMFSGLTTWAILNRPVTQLIARPAAAVPSSLAFPIRENNAPVLVINSAPVSPAPITSGWAAWLALLWLAGATAMIARAGVQVAGAERLRRSAVPVKDAHLIELLNQARKAVGLTRRVRIVVTDKLTSPAVVGLLLPTLILPLSLTTALTAEQVRFILLHELAHVRRGDYIAGLFQLLVEALLFFNPAVWWISRQMRIEREVCCDTLAVQLSGAPADYARTLVRVAESVLCSPPAPAPAFGDPREPSSLADRLQRMLVPGYRPALRLTWRTM